MAQGSSKLLIRLGEIHGHDAKSSNNLDFYLPELYKYFICRLYNINIITAPARAEYIRNKRDLVTRNRLPGEMGMFSLVQDNDDVTWLNSRLLVSFSVENDLLTISHSCGS